MDPQAIFDAVAARFGERVRGFVAAAAREVKDGARDAFFVVEPGAVLEVMTFLRDEPVLRFEFLQDLTAVDWPKQGRIDVVYHLHSYAHGHEIVVKAELPRSEPRVPSVASVWKVANWHEREQYDLFGVVFDGHPDLRRLLMPDDWVGHPMRKDWAEPKSYRGMPTSRPSPIDLIALYDKEHAPKPQALPKPAEPVKTEAPKPEGAS